MNQLNRTLRITIPMDEYEDLERIAAPSTVGAYVLNKLIRPQLRKNDAPIMIHNPAPESNEVYPVFGDNTPDDEYPDALYGYADRAALESPADFADMTDEDILNVRGFGPATLEEIREYIPYG